MITLGDNSSEVSKLQKYLSMIGYDLVIDGCFGIKTLRSLKAFQKKYKLVVDGLADSKTLSAIKAAQKRTSKENKESRYIKSYGDMVVDVDNHLDPEQYIKQIFNKDKVFIHYTTSGPNAKSVINYWNGNSPRVSTAFVISGRGEEDGKIYEAYNPDYWSYHLGVKGTKGALDRNSIGIELCAWGRLEKRGEKYYNVYGTEVPADEVYKLEDEWRGSLYYHSYTDKQLESIENLLSWIIKNYKIPIQDIEFNRDWMEYNLDLVKSKTPGIWTHTNVRTDKSDIYPDKRVFDMLNRIRINVNGK